VKTLGDEFAIVLKLRHNQKERRLVFKVLILIQSSDSEVSKREKDKKRYTMNPLNYNWGI